MMVGYIYDSTTLWRIWDPAFRVVRSQSDVISTRRGMTMHHVYPDTKQTSLNYQRRRNRSRKFKRVEIDFAITTQEPVEQVKATEVVIMTERTMIQTTFCPTLTIVKVPLQVQV
jgi:hypothetical protein